MIARIIGFFMRFLHTNRPTFGIFLFFPLSLFKKEMSKTRTYITIILTLMALGCSRSGKQLDGGEDQTTKTEKEGILSGLLDVLVDESILPLMREQEDVFLSAYPNARLNLIARPEVLAVQDLLAGKASVAVLARELTEEESAFFTERSIFPKIFPVATDAIALVGHAATTDTIVTLDQLFEMMRGAVPAGKTLLFDHLNASTFRHLREMGGLDRVSSANVAERNGARAVLEEVSRDETKIGVLGYHEYLDLKSKNPDFSKKVRTFGVRNPAVADRQYYRPSQSTIAAGQYPLCRMFYVLNCQPNIGLGVGFSAFLTGDRGQRIVLKSGVVPAKMPGRELIIRDRL